MSAESNMQTPASRQMSTRRVASAALLSPHALNVGVVPPNVPVPKLKTGTVNPPSCRVSIWENYGSANTRNDSLFPVPFVAATTATYCLPSFPWYVIGIAVTL